MNDPQINRRPVPEVLQDLSQELFRFRDLMLTMSEVLQEIRLGMPTTRRDEVRTEVERYLCRLREAEK